MIRRWLGAVGTLLLVGYLGACGYLWATQRQAIFEPAREFQTTPARMGLSYEEVHIPVGQGEIAGWWIAAENAAAPTVLYLHGNYRNRGYNLDHAARLHGMGCNVLVIDYRGYGDSSAVGPTEQGVYADAEAAWQYLLKTRGVPAGRAFLFGHSLGGAIAIDLAVRHPEAAGLITEGTFTSMQAMAERDYGFLPVGLLLNQRFDSIAKISRLKMPLLLIHGTWDPRIPVAMADALYAAAPQPKQLLKIAGGEHNNSGVVGKVEYRAAVSAFIRQHSRQ